MRTGGEQLGDTGSVETSLGKTESGTETGTTGTNDEGIVGVVNDGVLGSDRALQGEKATLGQHGFVFLVAFFCGEAQTRQEGSGFVNNPSRIWIRQKMGISDRCTSHTDDSLAFKGLEAKTCIAGREVWMARLATFLAATVEKDSGND